MKFDSHYKTKVINIGDNVRLDAQATKLGIKTKIRGDLWSGPFKVIGKSGNGNLKLNIGKSKLYRDFTLFKLAEILFENLPMDKKKIDPPKNVKFAKNIQF